MINLTCENLCREIMGIGEDVSLKRRMYKEQFNLEAPDSFKVEVFQLMLDINQKISSYNFAKTWSNSSLKNDTSLDLKDVLNKVKKIVEKLKKKYYDCLVDDTMMFIFNLENMTEMKPIKSELRDLKESIRAENFIKNHEEYEKISDLMYYVEEFDKIRITTDRNLKETYKLIGIKQLLIEYQKHLEDILLIQDENLRRAMLKYLLNANVYAIFSIQC